MPDGVLAPTVEVLPGPMCVDLETAVLPVPSTSTGVVAPIPVGPGSGTLREATPEEILSTAFPGPVQDLVWFERVHVVPRFRDLGPVLSDQELDVEVWNAYRSAAQVLTAIAVEGPAGVEVENPWGLPTHFPATDSRVYVIHVYAEGDPRIDNLVTWTFTGIPDAGTGTRLLGFRVLPWPFDVNMSGPIRESYGYLTNILPARDGTEQRVQLRAVAVGTLTLSALLHDARDAQHANALLYGNQARQWGVPLWQYRERLVSVAAAEQRTIVVNTSHIPWVLGGLIFLWRNPYLWEVQRVAEIHSTHLVTTLDLQRTWDVPGTCVLPLVIGRLSDSEVFSWESLKVGSVNLTFDVDGFFP